ncbi:hypothetical protein GQ42DRAFT_47469 [Ramicandelaber brevisporus]|nr:hypothetical protein GQ42DRAFT_47469 [Ramicandelaber brevisporus]
MKFTALGLAVLAGAAALLHSSVVSGEPVKCFNDTALLELIGKLADKCTNYDLSCAPSCDEAMKCYFKEMGLWDPTTKKIDWKKTKNEFELLYGKEHKGIADTVFEEFKKAEFGKGVNHGLVTRYMKVAEKYCSDADEEGIGNFKCEDKCKS